MAPTPFITLLLSLSLSILFSSLLFSLTHAHISLILFSLLNETQTLTLSMILSADQE